MDNLRGSKRPVETILVTKGNRALVAGGTNLTASNGNVNIADGQLLIGNVVTNKAITAGNTPTQAPIVRVYQGTNTSNDIPASREYPAAKRPYEVSGPILGNNVTVYTGKAYENPVRSAWTIGKASGSGVGEIVAADETAYTLNIALRGRRVDEFHSSVHGVPVMSYEYTTPEYSVLTAIADKEDHLIQNLAWKINRNSREFSFDSPSYGATFPVIALAIDSAGGSGVLLNSAVGTTIPIIATSAGNKGIIINDDYFATFAALIASGDVPATATVALIDVATAGSATCDQIVLVALDERLAIVDRNKSTKIRLEVGAIKGFEDSLVVASKSVDSFEGQGTYRQWKLFYDNTAGQRKYNQYRGFELQNIEYPDSLVPGEKYNAYIIEHFSSNHTDFTGISNSPLKTIILVPTGDTVTKASLEATLNPYLAPLPAVTL